MQDINSTDRQGLINFGPNLNISMETMNSTSQDISNFEHQGNYQSSKKKRWFIIGVTAGLIIAAISTTLIVLLPRQEQSSLSLTTEKEENSNKDKSNIVVKDSDENFHRDVVKRLHDTMLRTVDPCDDFYHYACGKWNIHSRGLISWNNFLEMENNIENEMIKQLQIAQNTRKMAGNDKNYSFLIQEQNYWRDAHPSIVELVSTYYTTCKNETLLTHVGANPLKQVLSEMDEVYSSKETHLDSLTIFQDILEYVHHKLAIYPLFIWEIKPDLDIANSMAIKLIAPITDSILQGTAIEGNTKLAIIYKQYAKTLLQIAGTYQDNDPEDEVDIIINLLKTFQSLKSSESLEILSIAELNSLTPFLNWTKFFNTGFNKIGVIIEEERIISHLSQEYFKTLSTEIISEISQYNSRRLYLYLRWQVIQYYSQFLHEEVRNLIAPLHFEITGNDLPVFLKPNYRCSHELYSRLKMPMTYLYKEMLKTKIGRQAIMEMFTEIRQMFMNLRDTYSNYITSFKWLQVNASDILINKINSIKISVGYPPIIDDISALVSEFSSLQFTKENPVQNQLKLLKFNQERKMRFLRQPESYTSWEEWSSLSVPTFYAYKRNIILIPIGGLQYPLYSSRLRKVLTYATMGTFISHEIGHAIDLTGTLKDRYGQFNLRLWNDATYKEIKDRVSCRIEESIKQYYPVDTNKRATVDEIMADYGSLRTAYQAIHENLQSTLFSHPLQYFMDDHNLSNDQLFFLLFAQLFCEASPPGGIKNRLDPHPPNAIRVRAILANTPAFHQAFNCSLGSNMNPLRNQNCDIW